MAIIVGDVIHIDQIIRVDGVNCVFGANYQLEDAGTTINDLDLMTSLLTDNWTPTLMDGAWQLANSDQITATCVRAQKILPLPEGDFIFVQNISGLVIGDNLPAHAAAMVVKTSKSNGPGSSGRSFLPGPPEVHFPGGRLDVAGAVLWDAVASFFNDILTLGAFGTRWAPQHVRGDNTFTDVFRTWVSPNIRTIKSRQAVECPI